MKTRNCQDVGGKKGNTELKVRKKKTGKFGILHKLEYKSHCLDIKAVIHLYYVEIFIT